MRRRASKSFRTPSMRATGNSAPVSSSTSESSRSGRAIAISCATMPPIEWPTRWNCSKPAASIAASTSSAMRSIV